MVIIICGAGAAKGNGIFYGKDIGKGDTVRVAGEAKLAYQEPHGGEAFHKLLVSGDVTERLKAQMPAAQILMYMVSSASHQHLSQ